MIKVCAFDCFGTVFDSSSLPRELVRAYVQHVNAETFAPYVFPQPWYELPAHRDSMPGIRSLRQYGIKCVAMSNGSPDLILALSKNAGIEWDLVIDLASHGVYKPHPGAYRVVECETGVTPAECLMVTANPTFGDVQGAMSVGMHAQVIRGPVVKTIIDLAWLLQPEQLLSEL